MWKVRSETKPTEYLPGHIHLKGNTCGVILGSKGNGSVTLFVNGHAAYLTAEEFDSLVTMRTAYLEGLKQ